MKKSFIILSIVCFVFATSLKAQQANSATQQVVATPTELSSTASTPITVDATEDSFAAEAYILNMRLIEISEMDKSELNFSEKRKLRAEVRIIKKTLETNNGGVYLSVGAVIIILLLLIIIL